MYQNQQYQSESLKARSKITDELLIKLINENPEMNMTEIGELVGVSVSAISYRLKKINKNGKKLLVAPLETKINN
ncbi:hypothetical protein CONCODRAFT_12771 [Conidiobolus coronatus NRRL 28638]|uniref:HTH asnC-type domain-containing protein n=1 Tax=Conidiobolus coronatus (strain ATCC 28846 / CBS 209.66 / NRRL 28638) TaxID=796925 RepID=A0A137NS85_CONC2|nr:hypothetical protein CONCODRAFT_12771 [Conidiobolus coronatus NRRL 28638]|eukprot:KXN65594.1 hypothetical protein CONCODRAFT_12771 [Conidiobolus coronatus NRRL 28638]